MFWMMLMFHVVRILLVLWDCVFIVSCDGASVITDMKMRLLEDALIQPEAPHFTGKVFISTPVHILNAASARARACSGSRMGSCKVCVF